MCQGFFLNQFWRTQEDNVWEFLAEACLVSQVPDAVLGKIMKDSRVARTAPEIEHTLAVAMRWLVELPIFVFEKLAGLSCCSATDLRSHCIHAAHRCLAFFNFRVLSVANSLPWIAAHQSLVRGDMNQNLIRLKAGPKPQNGTAGKLWELLRLEKLANSVLTRMVILLGDTPWSSTVVEQLHGTIAALSRVHQEYEVGTLMARSMCLFLSKLLPSQSTLEKTGDQGGCQTSTSGQETAWASCWHTYVPAELVGIA